MKNKKIVAVSLAGVLVDKRPWNVAHKIGMREHLENLEIDGVVEDIGLKSTRDVVRRSVEKSWPDLSESERIAKRREIYFDRVFGEIGEGDVNGDVVKYLRGIKDRYELVLVTTNNASITDKILIKIGCEDLFDEVFVSEDDELLNKWKVVDKVIGKNSKIDLMVDGSDKGDEEYEVRGIRHLRFEGLDGLRRELDD